MGKKVKTPSQPSPLWEGDGVKGRPRKKPTRAEVGVVRRRGRPKGSKNRTTIQREQIREALKKVVRQKEIPPIVPEEGLVCLGDGCFCHRLIHKNNGAENRCAYRKKGGKCDALF